MTKKTSAKKKLLTAKKPTVHHYNLRSNSSKNGNASSSRNVLKCPSELKKLNSAFECSICLGTEEYKRHKKINCGHVFHSKCINNWLKRVQTCPMCRALVPTKPRGEFDIARILIQVSMLLNSVFYD